MPNLDWQTLLVQTRNVHAFQHHGGQVQCWTDCPTCMALQVLAMAMKAPPPPLPDGSTVNPNIVG